MASAAGWVGGDHIKAQQWGCGATHSGGEGKKFGSAGAKRRGRFRFNPNPTRSSHPSCQIAMRSRIDKDKFLNSPRPVQYFADGKVRSQDA